MTLWKDREKFNKEKMKKAKTIIFNTSGEATTLHDEIFPFQKLGEVQITRWSNIEFNNEIKIWEVSLCKDPEKILFQNFSRTECLKWEKKYWEQQGK